MTTLLSDSFAGSGPLDGHLPNTTVGGSTWFDGSGNLDISGGKISYTLCPSATDSSSNTVIALGTATWPRNFTLTFDFTTSSSTTMATDGWLGFSIGVESSFGAYVDPAAELKTDPTLSPRMFINGGSASVTLTPYTTYSVVISFATAGGAKWISVGGTSYRNDFNIGDGTSLVGVSRLFVRLGYESAIGNMKLIDSASLFGGVTKNLPAIAAIVTGTAAGAPAAVVFSTPALTANATGHDATVRGTQDLVLPALSVAARNGGDVLASLPKLGSYVTGHDSSGEYSAVISLPTLTVAVQGGATTVVPLPGLKIYVQGETVLLASTRKALPALSAVGNGTISASVATAITLPNISASGTAGGGMSVSLPALTSSGVLTVGGIGGVSIVLPLFEAVISGKLEALGSAGIGLPSLVVSTGICIHAALPALTLTAIGSATITATYEAYAVNLNHLSDKPVDEVTRYTNFPFTQVARYLNSYFGLGADGNLYLLEGTTDNGTAIPWAFKTAITDFGTPLKKTISSAYFGGRFGPASAVALYPGEDGVTTYSYSTPRDALAQNHRQKFGKGLKERYYAIGASGTGTLELDSIELDVHNTTRRI